LFFTTILSKERVTDHTSIPPEFLSVVEAADLTIQRSRGLLDQKDEDTTGNWIDHQQTAILERP
jgi:hypothetical protein